MVTSGENVCARGNQGAFVPSGPGRADLSAALSPVFLVGAERSGTTLLRLMLDSHPCIAFNCESDYLVTEVGDDGRLPSLDQYLRWLPTSRAFRNGHFEVPKARDYRSAADDIFSQLRRRSGKTIYGATVHHDFAKLPYVFPDARYIHLLRDGRDVALSIVELGWHGNAYAAARSWLVAEHQWSTLASRVDAERRLDVRYESLIGDPPSELARICRWMGVAYSDQMFDYVNHTSYRMPDQRHALRWKRTMSRRNVRLVESRIGSMLVERQYPLSGHPPLTVNIVHRNILEALARLLRYWFRVRTYGLVLILQETVSRRLNSQAWHRQVTRRIDDLVDKNLK